MDFNLLGPKCAKHEINFSFSGYNTCCGFHYKVEFIEPSSGKTHSVGGFSVGKLLDAISVDMDLIIDSLKEHKCSTK